MSDARVVYKRGAWDPFHIGHLNVLQAAANLGDILVVGVATDDHIRTYKHREPFFTFCDRVRIVSELRCVDFVAPYTSAEDIAPVDIYNANIIVVDQLFGEGGGLLADHQRRAIKQLRKRGVSIVRIPRTPNVSSTRIRAGRIE